MRNSKMLILFLVLALTLTGISINYTLVVEARNSDMFEEVDDPKDAGIPDVSVDDASGWAERKGFEIVGFLQKFVQPFSIIIFIGCAILALIGAFGNGRMVSRGFMGMFISLIMYVVVLYAPEIMDVFLAWIRT